MSILLSIAAYIGALQIVKHRFRNLKFAGSVYAVILLSYEIYVLLQYLRGVALPASSEIDSYSFKNVPLVIYFWEVGKYGYKKITQAIRQPVDTP